MDVLPGGHEVLGTGPQRDAQAMCRSSTAATSTTWTEMAVDYRAVAHRAILAGADEQNLWLATDNGMILKLK